MYITLATSITFSIPVSAGWFDGGNNSNQPQQPTQQQASPDPATLVIQKSQQQKACSDRCYQQYQQNLNRCPQVQDIVDPFTGLPDPMFSEPDPICDMELQQIWNNCSSSCYR